MSDPSSHRLLLACLALLISACSYGRLVQVPHDPRIESDLREYIAEHEENTGMKFLGDFEVRVVRAYRTDSEGISISLTPRGHWAAAWVQYAEPGDPFVLTIAQMEGKSIPGKVLQHEALHFVLLSNGVVGHPERYADLAWRWHDHGREPRAGEEDYTEEEYARKPGEKQDARPHFR